jgi:hypothetical protein
MVNDPAIHLFGDPVIKASVTGFHVIDGDSHTPSHYGRETAVRVAENQQAVGTTVFESAIDTFENSADLSCERIAANTEKDVRFPNAELLKEYCAQPVVEVLSSMQQGMVCMRVQEADDGTQANDFRPRAENRQDFHRSRSPGAAPV